ncbi:hypothetical protein GOP47_0009828 [Adiantum capillus-veneris]|uniref:Pentatricopeptide repeat-containing protein n=1 Tax=Adiantum capillus-veneris TaxID=13818 RepID=A0A9D4UXV2_ADICA|nr:hypothetical protein GOP47_0009828 [Adiantum capillus-veneris]
MAGATAAAVATPAAIASTALLPAPNATCCSSLSRSHPQQLQARSLTVSCQHQLHRAYQPTNLQYALTLTLRNFLTGGAKYIDFLSANVHELLVLLTWILSVQSNCRHRQGQKPFLHQCRAVICVAFTSGTNEFSEDPIVAKVQTAKKNYDCAVSNHGLLDKCLFGNKVLSPFQIKSKFFYGPQAQVQAMTVQADFTTMVDNEVLEDDASIIGGIDVSALVRKVPSEPSLRRAVRMIDIVMDRNIKISINTFSALIQRCSRERDLILGKKCGSAEDAQKVFDEMSRHNIYSWTTLISAYANKGMIPEAIDVFMGMQKTGNEPDGVLFGVLLQACGRERNLEQGKWLHDQIRYVHEKRAEVAFRLYEQMQEQHIEPNEATLVSIFEACVNTVDVKRGELIHSHSISSDFESDLLVGSSLVDMYVKSGNLMSAVVVFNKMYACNIYAWNSLIVGHVDQALDEDALHLYRQLCEEGCEVPDEVTFASVIEACRNLESLEEGRKVHNEVIRRGLDLDPSIGILLITLYSSCNCIHDARLVFDSFGIRDVAMSNAMSRAYAQQGLAKEADLILHQMKEQGL